MKSLSVARPNAADLVLRTFNRTLHPDLLCHHKALILTVPGVSLEVRLIASGHALILQAGRQTLTEVISDRNDAHPIRGRLFEQKLKGSGAETVEFESGLRYDICSTLERMSLTVFLRQHEELAADGAKATLYAESSGQTRFSPGPLSLIRADINRRSVLVHAFHTFPEQLAVVKTQSLIEMPD